MMKSTSIELLKRAAEQLELEIANYNVVPSRLSHLVADINQYLTRRIEPPPTPPSRLEADDGSVTYVDQNGNYHRDDGPAIIQAANGNKLWYHHGRLHRTDGPAIEYGNGDKSYLIHGRLHRDHGPAIDWREVKSWYNHGDLIAEPKK